MTKFLSLSLSLLTSLLTSPALAATPFQGDQASEGEWEPEVFLPLQPIHSILLKNGKILCLDNTTLWPDTLLIDPVDPSAQLTWTVPTQQQPENFFCGAHAQLADGRVLFVGGGGTTSHAAHDKAYTFKPDEAGNPWTEVDEVPANPADSTDLDERWYATATTLGTGEVLLSGGRANQCIDTPTFQDYPLVFDPQAQGFPTTPQWSRLNVHPTSQKVVHAYPFMFQLPDQTVFLAGGAYFTPTSDPSIHLDTYCLNPALGTWGPTPVARAAAPGGSAVLYRPDKVMKAGSGSPCPGGPGDTTSQVETIDLSSPTPQWTVAAPMQFPRRYFYMISMPDGRVLASGGQYHVGTALTEVLVPEWMDPDEPTPSWQSLASMSRARTYHSSGVLLPDGRVFMAGTGANGHDPEGTNCQFFRPPYLFAANNQDNTLLRPRIDEVQTADVLEYGKGAYVYLDTAYPHDVDSSWKVSLIRLGAATHSLDQNQRFLWLDFVPEPAQARLRVAAPAHSNLAPPGHYMLFVLKEGDRVDPQEIYFPSIAKIVQVK